MIQSSTELRGSVAGLLFDKSLSVRNGGVNGGTSTIPASVSPVTESSSLTTTSAIEGKNNVTSFSTTKTTTASSTRATTTDSASLSASSELGIGGVLNLMQSDTSIIESAALQIHTSWDGPLQISIYTALLYKYLGPSVFYGLAVMLVTIPLNSVTLRLLNKLATAENYARDVRTKQTSESIRNMKLLKVQNWERLFAEKISQYRIQELNLLVRRGIVRALNMAISNAVPAIVLVVTLTAYVKSGKPLIASTIFTAISLFNQLRFPLFFYPMFIDSIANGKNAMKRITKFLNAPEIVSYVQVLPPLQLNSAVATSSSTQHQSSDFTGGSIEMKNGNFLWSSSVSSLDNLQSQQLQYQQDNNDYLAGEQSTITNSSNINGQQHQQLPELSTMALVNVNLKVNPGEIVAIVGSVGSGKSALIKGLLGELEPCNNKYQQPQILKNDGSQFYNQGNDDAIVTRHGDVAYCAQESWLPKGSIRDAIVFGRPYNERRYRQAIYNAGLDEDIADGDCWPTITPTATAGKTKQTKAKAILTHDTDVGEGGASLSGGQRQRVAIARALYGVVSSSDNTNDADDVSGGVKVLLLDDCLAALDAHVGSVVFERMTRFLRNSSVRAATVLVTNDPNIPRRCDRVVLMGPSTLQTSGQRNNMQQGSTILDQGSYDDLLRRGHNLRSFSSQEDDEEVEVDDDEIELELELELEGELLKTQNLRSYSSTFNGANDTPSLASSMRLTSITSDEKNMRSLDHDEGFNMDAKKDLLLFPSISDDDVGCHADVEGHATMQSCPDAIAQHNIDSRSIPTTTTSFSTPSSASSSVSNNPIDDYQTVTATEVDYKNVSYPLSGMVVSVPVVRTEHTSQVYTKPSVASSNHYQQVSEEVIDATSTDTDADASRSAALASADDTMSSGAVPLSTYFSYFKAVGNPLLVVAMISAYLLSNSAQFFQQYTVAKWTELGPSAALVSAQYMSSLVRVAVFVSFTLWLRSYLIMSVGIRASKTYHTRMLQSVFAAPMSFFDATPSGQLLSRFGKELDTIDRGVPDSIGSVLYCFLQIGLSMGALAGAVTPGLLVPLGIISLLYIHTMSKYRPAAREMKRIEAKTRSPIYTHFGEALRGSETIRSIRLATKQWSQHHKTLMDVNVRAFFTVKSLDRWLSTRLETLGNTVVFAAALSSVILTQAGKLKAGSAGWGLTQALSVTGLLTWAVRCLTDLESDMLSVIRVQELTSMSSSSTVGMEDTTVNMKLLAGTNSQNKKEASTSISRKDNSDVNKTNDPLDQEGWPWRGMIQFKNVSMRYTPKGPYVLRNVDLTIPAGTTLGVVGRTGSGKSSLLSLLFRLVDIESSPSTDGDSHSSIEIDGVDIRSVPMSLLRQSLAIIPQDPVLFTGTLAYNLDATGRTSRQEMIAALEAASPSLVELFIQSSGKLNGSTINERDRERVLDTYISEGGKNLSLGQRQLICLARALLRKSKILVLDEATSSVDAQTDQEVQETIRREFVNKGVTVITVAHRLETVLGYDNIAVLGNGRILEYGPPADLIAIPNGEFRRLVIADKQNQRKGSKAKQRKAIKSKSATIYNADTDSHILQSTTSFATITESSLSSSNTSSTSVSEINV